MKFEKLLQPGKIGTMELKNRMIQPAMGTNYSDAEGFVTQQLVNYISRRAEGGVGMIITEICLADPKGKVIPGELDLSDDKFIPGMAKLVNAAHAGGAKIAIQFAHGGCFASKALTGLTPVTPSGISTFQLENEECRQMTVEEIRQLVKDYGTAAGRGVKAGFDAVEIHGAHGYMPLQFLSPYTNRRTDAYGGSLENRARFAIEVIREVRKNVGPKFPIIYRLSAEEYTIPQGVTLEEACRFAEMVEKEGVNAIHVTAGTWDSRYQYFEGIQSGELNPDDYDTSIGVGCGSWIPPHFTPRGVLIPLAAEVKKHVSLPIITVNSVSPELGEQAIRYGKADFVAIGRQSFADPDYPKKVKEQRPEDIRRCLRCNVCHSSLVAPYGVECQINPQTGKEGQEYVKISPAEVIKNIAVVGGGPAGMVAAIVASERGHRVTLYEAEPRLGGALYYASRPGFKDDFKEYLKYLIHRVYSSAIDVKLGTKACTAEIRDKKYDAVIVATGSHLAKPPIDGIDTIYSSLEALDGKIPEGENIIVCGAGLVGCETAMYLAEQGKKATVVDMVDVPAPDAAYYLKYNLWAKMMELRVREELGCTIKSVSPTSVTVVRNGKEETFIADAVINSLGMESTRDFLEELREACPALGIETVGDVNQPKRILQAVHQGYHAGRRI